MIVVNTNKTQTLKIIPRDYLGAFTIDVRDTSLNKNFTYFNSTSTTVGNYLQFEQTYVNNASDLASIFKEARYYDFELYADFNYWNMNLSLFASSLLQIGIFIAIVTFFIFVISVFIEGLRSKK